MIMTITVVCRESGSRYSGDVLIYTVDADPSDAQAVETAVDAAHAADLGFDVEMEILFAFAGDIQTVADWRS